ncbi:DUF1992 domain-containing protein [Halobacillus sp. MO56]
MKEDKDEKIYRDWMSEIVRKHEAEGGFDDLPGKGKPLPADSLKGDVFTSIVKNANYRPEWVRIQQRVREAIRALQSEIINERLDDKTKINRVKKINRDIKKYNQCCPVKLQKPPATLDDLEADCKRWE